MGLFDFGNNKNKLFELPFDHIGIHFPSSGFTRNNFLNFDEGDDFFHRQQELDRQRLFDMHFFLDEERRKNHCH